MNPASSEPQSVVGQRSPQCWEVPRGPLIVPCVRIIRVDLLFGVNDPRVDTLQIVGLFPNRDNVIYAEMTPLQQTYRLLCTRPAT